MTFKTFPTLSLPFALVAVALFSTNVHATAPITDGYVQVRHTLVPGVHVLAQREPFHVQPLGNVTLIEQSDGIVLVDAGGTPTAGHRIVEEVRRLGPKPVKAVVLTHWHGDHVLGAAAIRQAWPDARLVATRHTGERMRTDLAAYRNPGKLQLALSRVGDGYRQQAADPTLASAEREGFQRSADEVADYAAQFDGADILVPDEFVDSRLDLADDRVPVVILHPGPANTPGDLVAWLPAQQVAVVGDIVVSPVPFAFDVDPPSWIRTLGTISAWSPRWVVPGHGAPQEGTEYLGQLARWLCAAHARGMAVRQAGDAAPAAVDLSDQVDAISAGDPWLRRWARAYWAEPLAASVAATPADTPAACAPDSQASAASATRHASP